MKALRILAIVLVATSLTALAQKPALVKDVEANGRLPYLHTVETTCPLNNPGSCATQTFPFPQVPTGYRLVVTYVSVLFPTKIDDPLGLTVLLTNGQTSSDTYYAGINLPTPVCSARSGGDPNVCVSSAPVSFYVEPGSAPNVTVSNGCLCAFFTKNTIRVSVIGYLISTN